MLGGFNLYQYAPNGLTWIDPWGLTACNTTFSSRKSAFRAAKREAGLAMNQHPIVVKKVPLTDRKGHLVMDDNYRPLESREYHFVQHNGSKIVIQEHSAGHIYGPKGTSGNQGPHFNIRPLTLKQEMAQETALSKIIRSL